MFHKINTADGPVDSIESDYLKLTQPEYARRVTRRSGKLANYYLDTYYERVRKETLLRIKQSLNNGYGTIAFDGWEDVNRPLVVNIMMKVETGTDRGRRIFFLKTFYPGSRSMTAAAYKEISESTLDEFIED